MAATQNQAAAPQTVEEEAQGMADTVSLDALMEAYCGHAKNGGIHFPNPNKKPHTFGQRLQQYWENQTSPAQIAANPAQTRPGKLSQAMLAKAIEKYGADAAYSGLQSAVEEYFEE